MRGSGRIMDREPNDKKRKARLRPQKPYLGKISSFLSPDNTVFLVDSIFEFYISRNKTISTFSVTDTVLNIFCVLLLNTLVF